MFSNFLSDKSELHLFQDKSLDFCAVISLQQYGRGSAIGGCRMQAYPSIDVAVQEAIRLANVMSYKAAISELPHDGGKAVIMRPKNFDPAVIFKLFAACVDTLAGKYITTIDSGTTQADMSIIKSHTPFVTGYLTNDRIENNPAISTALGIFKGMQAAQYCISGEQDLAGLHIAIQGVGSVGWELAKLLFQAGARLTVCDTNLSRAKRCLDEFNATVVAPAAIYQVECDIFSPCALGQVINLVTVSLFRTKIIAGAANDQLASIKLATRLEQRGIFYVPDYLINAGGLIHLSLQHHGQDSHSIEQAVTLIGRRVLVFAEQARAQGKTLFDVVQTTAETALFTKPILS